MRFVLIFNGASLFLVIFVWRLGRKYYLCGIVSVLLVRRSKEVNI